MQQSTWDLMTRYDFGNKVKLSLVIQSAEQPMRNFSDSSDTWTNVRNGAGEGGLCILRQRDVRNEINNQTNKQTNQIIHVAWALVRCRSTRRSPDLARRTSCPAPAPIGMRSPPLSPPPPGGPRKNRKIASFRCSSFRSASSRTASPASDAEQTPGIHARITESALRPRRNEDLWRDTLAPTISRNYRAFLARLFQNGWCGGAGVETMKQPTLCDNLYLALRVSSLSFFL